MVTSQIQMTEPKAIADEYGIKPGDEISWTPVGAAIRVVTGREAGSPPDLQSRVVHFDEATERQWQSWRRRGARARTRGWTREELYHRGHAR